MKSFIVSIFLLLFITAVNGQDNKSTVLENLEKNQGIQQEVKFTAILKSASRLFGSRDDLTSVITIIPAGSEVNVLGIDSTYLKVVFEDNEGYIYRRHADLNPVSEEQNPSVKPAESIPQPQPQPEVTQQPQQESRFSYLEKKYGSSMAAKLMSGKIWKGMDSEMVRDSWGTPGKINRVISGNIVKEEWIYKSTWLYIENDRLTDWGAIR